VKDSRESKVWEKGHPLTLAVYRTTATFPPEERYGLTSRIGRSRSSVPAHIAEGWGRDGGVEAARFLVIASGSPGELGYRPQLAHDLNLLETREHGELTREVTEVKRMLAAFIQKPKDGR
jgi:four helix bundle protein